MPHSLEPLGPRRFYLFQLWFLIPGILLLGASIYIPLSYLHKQIFWTRTEASVLAREWNRFDDLIVELEFTDVQGEPHRIHVDSETYNGDPDKVPLYYDPQNPDEFQVVNHYRYFLVIFLPFGLFVTYLGWPHRDEKKSPAQKASRP